MNHIVLVVEDDDDLRETMRDALEVDGYTVVAARDGRDALDLLDGLESVCLVLLDLVMPRMNGWDFLVLLRQQAAFADVPVIIHCSATTLAPPRTATRVLTKPLEYTQLLEVVHEYCVA